MSVGRLPPTSAPQLPAARPATAPARDAQRAFFAAALGQAAPVQATPQAATPAAARPAAPAAPMRTPEPDAPPQGRYLRPGSLLDIKV